LQEAEMKNEDKTREQLLDELAEMRQRIAELEASKAGRKRVEEALRESEEWVQRLSAAAFEAIIIHEGGVLLGANDQYYEMFGYEPEELLGKQALPLTVAPEAIESMGKEIATGGLGPYESIGLKKDGTKFPIEIRVREMEYEGHKVRVAAIMNITERKRAEETLRESEQIFRRTFEAIPDPTFIWERQADGRIILTRANKAASIITRGRIESVLGIELEEFLSDEPGIISETRHVMDTGQAVQKERLYRTRTTQEERWVIEDKVRFTQDGVLIISKDITERKRAEEMLQRYNQRLMILRDIDRDIAMARSPRAIADTVLKYIRQLIPYWMANVSLYEPDTDEVVVLASEANGDTAMRPGMRVPTPAGWVSRMLTEHYNLVEDTHTLPEPISPAVRLAIAEGTRSYLSASLLVEGNLIGALILSSRTPAAFAAEHLEITGEVANQLAIAIHQARLKEQIERHAAEMEERVAQRTAELREVNAELEAFAYSVSHDLRAPLRAINGFAQIIARRHRDSLNEEGQHYFDNIIQASTHMGHLIDDLLRYSRLGRQAVRHQPVPMGDVLAQVADSLAGRVAETGAHLSLPDDLPVVQGDQTLLGQIFTNLLDNALTYHRSGVPPQVVVSCQAEADHVILSVADNGIGIPPEFHEKIFNIFQRLHSQDEYPGTGIGLAIVKKVVGLLGGQVWVESVVGEGSTFYVELPVSSEQTGNQ
jgi:PAS domain S-box-containing protein